MMKRLTHSTALPVFLLLVAATNSSVLADEPLRILFVGNSYTAQIRGQVTGLFKASEYGDAELVFVCPGGKTLAYHSENKETTGKIAEGEWDFVVLQDQSQTPAVFPRKFMTAAIELDKLIGESGAQTVYYQTWGRRDGDKMNSHLFPTYESMQKALSKAYSLAARRQEAVLAPVGDAWSKVRSSHETLGRELYKGDGSHPSAKGAYLAACVFYSAITGDDPAKVEYLGKLEENEAKTLRSIAYKTVAELKEEESEQKKVGAGR